MNKKKHDVNHEKHEEKKAEENTSSNEESIEKDAEIEALKQEVAKYKEAYVRSVADFENYKKRSSLELEKTSKYAISNFARDVLNVADALSRALKSMPAEENRSDQLKNFAIGAEMTLTELH